MTVMEKVRETANEFSGDVRESINHLKQKVGAILPANRRNAPARRDDAVRVHAVDSRRAPAPTAWAGWPDDVFTALDRVERAIDSLGQWPRLDVTENDRKITVRAELPGVDEKDVEVTLAGDLLTIRGEKRTEREDAGDGYRRHECSYGSFSRTVALPAQADPEKAEAKFRRGVLTVTLRKMAGRAGQRRVRVRAA
ncbi:MAG TPA: Hsp20/alpha crystallin family protein [Phycisphaerales bacterium]|nr:Hsp20/alpha crystallin family protein [Phycisphaerales bacterium]